MYLCLVYVKKVSLFHVMAESVKMVRELSVGRNNNENLEEDITFVNSSLM